jgi:hypothetical protein
MKTFTLGCPHCGGFVQGLDILDALAWLNHHRSAFLCTDHEYERRLNETLPDTAEAV